MPDAIGAEHPRQHSGHLDPEVGGAGCLSELATKGAGPVLQWSDEPWRVQVRQLAVRDVQLTGEDSHWRRGGLEPSQVDLPRPVSWAIIDRRRLAAAGSGRG